MSSENILALMKSLTDLKKTRTLGNYYLKDNVSFFFGGKDPAIEKEIVRLIDLRASSLEKEILSVEKAIEEIQQSCSHLPYDASDDRDNFPHWKCTKCYKFLGQGDNPY